MKQIAIEIPGALISYNYLYEGMPVDWREEDLLFLTLPNGDSIDVGWYPACDPKGHFKITRSDCNQNQIVSKEASDLAEAVRIAENFAKLPVGAVQGTVTPMAVVRHASWQSETNSTSRLTSVRELTTNRALRRVS